MHWAEAAVGPGPAEEAEAGEPSRRHVERLLCDWQLAPSMVAAAAEGMRADEGIVRPDGIPPSVQL